MQTPTKRQRPQKRLETPETVKKVKLEDETQATTVNESSMDSNKLESLGHIFPQRHGDSTQSTKDETTTKDENISIILSRPSLRERFANSCLGEDQQLTKSKYSHLQKILSVVDVLISFMKQRGVPTFFSNLQKNIKENNKIDLHLSQIQQIQTIWNEAYTLTWVENIKSNSTCRDDIQIHFFDNRQPSSKVLEERQSTFTASLSTYLKTNGDYVLEFPLPLKNKIQETFSSQISSILQKFNGSSITQSDLTHDINGRIDLNRYRNLSGSHTGLSQSLLQRVQQKESQIKHHQTPYLQFDSQQVQQVVSIIHNYYQVRNVSNMFLVNVVQYVCSNNKQYILDLSVVKLIIESLILKCPNWLTQVDNSAGKILRVNNSIKLPTLLIQLEL